MPHLRYTLLVDLAVSHCQSIDSFRRPFVYSIVVPCIVALFAVAQPAKAQGSGDNAHESGLAQPSLFVGFTTAYSLNYHSDAFSTGDAEPTMEVSSGEGFQAGVALGYRFTSAIEVGARLTTDARPGTLCQTWESDILLPGSGLSKQRIVDSTIIEYRTTTVDVMLAYPVLSTTHGVKILLAI